MISHGFWAKSSIPSAYLEPPELFLINCAATSHQDPLKTSNYNRSDSCISLTHKCGAIQINFHAVLLQKFESALWACLNPEVDCLRKPLILSCSHNWQALTWSILVIPWRGAFGHHSIHQCISWHPLPFVLCGCVQIITSPKHRASCDFPLPHWLLRRVQKALPVYEPWTPILEQLSPSKKDNWFGTSQQLLIGPRPHGRHFI